MTIETDEGLREIPVGKIDINLASKKDVNVALSNDNIAPEIKERIALRHKQVTESGYKMANVTLFSSELLPKNNVVSSGYSTQATSSSTYYTYNGAQMRSDKLFYDDLDTGYQYIKRGSSTKTITNGIVDIVMIVASTANVYVGFLASGISLLQAFNNMFGTTWATGSTEDFCQVKLIYDNTDQWTYRKIGNDWYLGLCSQKAVISNISSVQCYYNAAQQKGKSYPTSRNITKTHKSPHFDSPWATAYQWCYDPLTEWMTWKCGGVTFSF